MFLPALEETHQTEAVPTLGGHRTVEIVQADETGELFSEALHQVWGGCFLLDGHQNKATRLVWDYGSPLQSQRGDQVLCCCYKKLLLSSVPDYTKWYVFSSTKPIVT